MDIVIVPLLKVILAILGIYTWMLIIYAILSWLLIFGIVNPRSQFVLIVGGFLQRMIEPALRPLRRFIPRPGGFDLSFIALFFIIYFLELIIERLLLRALL